MLGDAPAAVIAGDIANTSPASPTTPEVAPSSRSVISEKLDFGLDGAIIKNTWSNGLRIGPNGPIPAIVIDQFGYPTKASKIAVIRDPQEGYDSAYHFVPGRSYALIEKSSGKVIKQGIPIAWNNGTKDEVSGDKAWWFDFSDVTVPGTYTVADIERGLRSPDFRIDDKVYRDVLKHALRITFTSALASRRPPRRRDPIGRMPRAIWTVGRILKAGRGNPRTCGARAMPM